MSKLFEQVNSDIKNAMKSKQKEKLEALRYLKSLFLQNNTSTKPQPELDILVSHCKKLKDSIKSFPEGNEQIAKVNAEVEFLKVYMPAELTQEDVQKLIDDIKASSDNPNMGLIMKQLSPQIKGRFDGKKASEMVKASL
jgi:uncharacterized protein